MAEINGEVETRLKQLSRNVKLHGFRPGKVPYRVVAQQYASQVRHEVIGATLEKSFGEAVRQQNLRVAGYPKFEARPLTEGATDFEYSATFEVYPEVALGDLSQVKIVRFTIPGAKGLPPNAWKEMILVSCPFATIQSGLTVISPETPWTPVRIRRINDTKR